MGYPIPGAWKDKAPRSLRRFPPSAYSVGELGRVANQRSSYAYVQIWQYDPKVANWGLRILLISPLPMSK